MNKQLVFSMMAVAAVVGIITGVTRTEAADEKVLVDLSSVEQLQKTFNADAGKNRLLLLLSPT